jgi:Fe-S cluster biogenesis protein NfuA
MDHKENGLLQNIQIFIDEKIAAGINSHGGYINIVSLENGILTLSLSGSCGSCSVQAYTTDSISNYILEEFPDLDNVIVQDE